MSRRRLGIRVRLTLLYGGLVLLAGAVVLAAVLTLLDRVIATQPIVLDDVYHDGLVAAGASGDEGLMKEAKGGVLAAADAVREDLRRRTLLPLIGPSLTALGVVGVAGFGAAWLVTGRALRPVRVVTGMARRVAADSLDGRIGLGGPHDELRDLADTFDAMLARLQGVFAAQRAFVGNASHELRTPVAISRTLLEVAARDPQVSPEVVSLAASLLEVNARQARIIEGLLTLARSANAITRPVHVDLDEVVTSVVGRNRAAARGRGVTLAAPTPGHRVVSGDRELLERLAENLVQNAIAYNEPTGGRAAVELFDDGAAVRLRVRNSGPHMSPDVVPTLFEPFRRAAGRVNSVGGTGLGLSIVATIAQAHGGEVTVTANPDGGLTVEVTLPAVLVADSGT
jgi:signal transduction histidine kinase